MSEYQVVAFRAIDGPVSKANLEYMQKQSSRAEITPRSFYNEYDYGDFHGNADEMLRRGYDLFLHYANFGTRDLHLRLPNGLPAAATPYLTSDGLEFRADKQGPGGILSITPFIEAGEMDDLWEIPEMIEELLPLRAEILDGDLRPLYLAHLVMASDGNHDPEEETEAPVPAGLDKPTAAQRAFMEFYGLSDYLIEAAAATAPPLPANGLDPAQDQAAWLAKLPDAKKNDWLARLLADSDSPVRVEMLAEFRSTVNVPAWPTVVSGRTIAALQKIEEESYQQANQKKAKAAERARTKQLAEMKANPDAILQETEKLLAKGGAQAYAELAKQLADLHAALEGTPQSNLAQDQARKFKERYPSRTGLISGLREKGLLPRKSRGS